MLVFSVFSSVSAVGQNGISPQNDEKSIDIDMIFVQGGTFMMGCTQEQIEYCDTDELPSILVEVEDFYIGKYEVTQKLWEEIMGTRVEQLRDRIDTNYLLYGQGENYPVYYVGWQDAQLFIERLNKKTGKKYRLPTEKEWEFAARGGNLSKGTIYAGSNNLNEVGWYKDNSEYTTYPIGGKKPNELGIYDMSGNVWEWVSDSFYHYDANNTINIQESKENYRIFRGGSWFGAEDNARVSNRLYRLEENRSGNLGFRLVMSAK
ncbi:MAG: formylglycine-generating enzyme family protein [Bacteroidales bacterium]|nr:formylglycine-generating enzyme family protein [Bacteroidales bacterium]